MTTAAEVYTQVKERIGLLANRGLDPDLAVDNADDGALETYLRDALREIAKRTGRLTASLTVEATPGQSWIDRPPHVDHIHEAQLVDGDTAVEVSVEQGPTTARKARAPTGKTGRPRCLGHHSGRLWLLPEPDQAYELRLEVSLNGEAPRTAFANGLKVPVPAIGAVSVSGFDVTVNYTPRTILDVVTAAVPTELERALVAYVSAEWLSDHAERQLAQKPRRRFERDVQKYDTDPMRDTTATRSYNPLGL